MPEYKKPTLKDRKGNPDSGDDNSDGLHSNTIGKDHDDLGEGRDDDSMPVKTPVDSKGTGGDEHKHDEKHIKVKNIEIVGSVSEYATRLLDQEVKKLNKLPPESRIVVINDKKDISTHLIPLIRYDDRKLGVLVHNQANHLPLFNRAVEDWCSVNDICVSCDMHTLLCKLGGKL